MNRAFLDYYRCPASLANFTRTDDTAERQTPGFFTLGDDLNCFGRTWLPADHNEHQLQNAIGQVSNDTCFLPFDPTEIAISLREEHYAKAAISPRPRTLQRYAYYALRPLLSVAIRRHLQRFSLRGWERERFPGWPVDLTVDLMMNQLMALAAQAASGQKVPFIWFWPDGHSGAAIMTHDVETSSGLRYIDKLMDTNSEFHIPASFQIIPDGRYHVTASILSSIRSKGFEVNVHDLRHDGHLFDDFAEFKRSAERINHFVEEFGAIGFRSAVLYRNQAWLEYLKVAYDMSVPNTGRLDPQHGGCCTVMPYFIGKVLELPVTATQDYTLFHILRTCSPDLWLEQIAKVLGSHGLLNFIVHPDYLDTPDRKSCYTQLLRELARLRAEANLWIALPREINTWWRQRSAMTLVRDGTGWSIQGEGSERARVMFARCQGKTAVYSSC
jgi:hypothetical protein